MLGMNEPQVWTAIGVFAAGMFGTITIVLTSFTHIMKTEFASVRKELGSVRTDLQTEIASVRTEMRSEFASVRTEISAVHGRIDHLDRDVNAIYRHLFGIDRG